MRVHFPGVRKTLTVKPKIREVRWPRGYKLPKPSHYKTGVKSVRKVGPDWKQYYLSVAPPPSATTSEAELLIYGWLVRHNIPFNYQVPFLGGRQVPGGAVLDFVVHLRYPATVIRVMGYYHKFGGQRLRDNIQKDFLVTNGYRVVNVWTYEVDTEDKLNDKMIEVLYGI